MALIEAWRGEKRVIIGLLALLPLLAILLGCSLLVRRLFEDNPPPPALIARYQAMHAPVARLPESVDDEDDDDDARPAPARAAHGRRGGTDGEDDNAEDGAAPATLPAAMPAIAPDAPPRSLDSEYPGAAQDAVPSAAAASPPPPTAPHSLGTIPSAEVAEPDSVPAPAPQTLDSVPMPPAAESAQPVSPPAQAMPPSSQPPASLTPFIAPYVLQHKGAAGQ